MLVFVLCRVEILGLKRDESFQLLRGKVIQNDRRVSNNIHICSNTTVARIVRYGPKNIWEVVATEATGKIYPWTGSSDRGSSL